MKKQLLLSSTFFTALSVLAQEPHGRPVGQVNHVEKTIQRDRNAIETEFTSTASQASPSSHAKTASPPLGNWGIIGGSRNAYGVLNSSTRPLQYNSTLNAISFTHRCSSTYVSSPANNSGSVVSEISTNWGVTWDSTCVWSNATNLGRYPGGAIYNPLGNTNINNAYIVASGPISTTGWTGSYVASKQLGSTNYNATASATVNAMQVLANNGSNPAIGKLDFAAYSLCSTTDGKIRVMGEVVANINATTNQAYGRRGMNVVTGTFNSGVFNWSGDSLKFNSIVRANATDPAGPYYMTAGRPMMAWNEAGTVGYAAIIGVRATPSNSQSSGYQPIVWQTTNGGTSWSSVPAIDFSSSTYSNVLKRIDPTMTNTNVTIPQFNTNEGIGMVVDANNSLHFVGTIINTLKSHPDSVGYSQNYTLSVNPPTATYSWPHTPGKRPYIYDFITNGLTWFYKNLDSMSTEAPSGVAGGGGYNENPFNVDGGGKRVSDARIQASRTPDGKFVFYSWAETDTNFVTGGLKYNVNPDIKVRGMDVMGVGGGPAYYLFNNEFNVSNVGNNPQIKGKSVMHYMSPTTSSVTVSMPGTTATVTIPFTVTHNDGAAPPAIPFESVTSNAHYFNAAKVTFTLSTPTQVQHVLGSVSTSYVYPNPASHSAILSIDMKDNAVVNVDVYNTIGQLVKSSKHTAQIGENNFNIDLANLSSGIYLVNVKVGNATSTKKLIVE